MNYFLKGWALMEFRWCESSNDDFLEEEEAKRRRQKVNKWKSAWICFGFTFSFSFYCKNMTKLRKFSIKSYCESDFKKSQRPSEYHL